MKYLCDLLLNFTNFFLNYYKGKENNQHLQHAYQLLRNVAESKPAVDTPESFGSDLYVICAEIAFQVRFYMTYIKYCSLIDNFITFSKLIFFPM